MRKCIGRGEAYVHLKRPTTARRVGCWVVVVVGVKEVVVIAGTSEAYPGDDT